MSNLHLQHVRDNLHHIKGPSKVLLMVIADYASPAGECFPGHGTLAKASGLGNSTVKKHLRLMGKEGAGLIDWETRKKPGKPMENDSNYYTLTFHGTKWDELCRQWGKSPRSSGDLGGGAHRDLGGGAQDDSGVGYNVPPGGSPRGYKSSFNHQLNPLTPLPPEGGESAGGKASLVEKIKSLRRRWGTGPTLDARDVRAFRKNCEGWTAYSAEDWKVVGEFMRAGLPDGTAYTQPRNLNLALGMPAALLADAQDWKGKQRQPSAPVNVVAMPEATAEDKAAVQEFLKQRVKS